MQAVRGVSRSALSCSKTTSASSLGFSNKDISNAIINGSNLGCCSRGRSFVASDSSSSTPQRVPKRVSKDERRVMLKAFVDKYRASNSGKYPTPSAVQKQVGGSYYVVKKILQEIEYNSQRSSVIISTTNEAPFEKVVPQEEWPPSPEATEISSSATRADLTSCAQSLGLKDVSQTVVTTNLDMDEAPFEKEVPQEECPPSLEATEISSSAAGADLTSSAQSLGLKDDSQTVVTTNLDMDEAPFEKEVPQEKCPPSLEATEISSSAAGADLTSSEQSLGLKDDSQTVVTTNLNLDMDEAPFEKEVPQEECPPFLEATEISSSVAGADLTSSAQSLGLKDDSQTVVTTNLDMDEATSSITQAKEETLGTIEMPFSKDALNSKTPVNTSNTDEDHSPPKRATVWGNLKSFADGIINMWRKM